MQIERPSEGQKIIPVIWYFAPRGAKTYYLPQAFYGGIWDYDKIALPPTLGEQPPYASPWYNGRNAWGYRGQCVIGTPDQYQFGLTAAELAAPAPRMLACCLGTETAYGGVSVGGKAVTQGVGPPPAVGGVQLGGIVAAQGFRYPERHGGVLLGGRVFTASPDGGPARGGVVLGGVIHTASPIAGPARGGVVLGGVVTTAGPALLKTRGGVVLGGVASTQSSGPVKTVGGVVLGGVIVTQQTQGEPVEGGVLLGGVVSTQQGYAIPTRGGVVLGGVIVTQQAYGIPTVGGVVLGGVIVDQSSSASAIGGVVLGGVVVTQPTAAAGTAGGVVLGGVVVSVPPPTLTTTGGVVLGGVVVTSGGTTAGVTTPCCPAAPTPVSLFAHFELSTIPANNQTIPITYDPALLFWHDDGSYFFGLCNAAVNVLCQTDILGVSSWHFQGNEFGFGWDITAEDPFQCAPMEAVFDLTTFAAVVEGLGCYPVGEAPRRLRVNTIP